MYIYGQIIFVFLRKNACVFRYNKVIGHQIIIINKIFLQVLRMIMNIRGILVFFSLIWKKSYDDGDIILTTYIVVYLFQAIPYIRIFDVPPNDDVNKRQFTDFSEYSFIIFISKSCALNWMHHICFRQTQLNSILLHVVCEIQVSQWLFHSDLWDKLYCIIVHHYNHFMYISLCA